jgi:MFS transporter, DHA1 family, multidrug resistance protein
MTALPSSDPAPEPEQRPLSAAEARRTRQLAPLEVILMVAALMAINALSIDIMLPAMPNIANSFGVANENDRQLVIVVYVMSSGFAQIFYGPLTDALGRRIVLLCALGAYLVGSIACLMAGAFDMFLLARGLQGVSAAATRVVAAAIVRDLFSGPRMAQIMSTAMTIFMIVPILAPGVGQVIMLLGPWRWIFALLLFAGVSLFVWCYFRVPETLKPENRIPLSFASAFNAYRQVLQSRVAMGYTLALTMVFSCLFAFLTSAQQIFVDIYGLGPLFPIAFASIAVTLSVSQFTNSRLVMKVGMRRLAHVALIGFAGMASLHAIIAHLWPGEPLWVFMPLLLMTMLLFAFMGPNFNAIAMEPMGHIAGAAAALMGFISTIGGSTIGGLIIGRSFDGTIAPMLTGQAVMACCAIAIIYITERGKMVPPPDPTDPLH